MRDGDRPDAGVPADQQGFVRQLNALRTWAGNPSYSELARRCDIPRSTLADTFTDKRKSLPSLDLVIRLVRALGCDRGEVERWSAAWRWLAARRYQPTEPAAEDQNGPGEALVMKLNPDGATEYLTMYRRDVLTIGATSMLGLMIPVNGIEEAARNPATLGLYRDTFDLLRRKGQTVSPGMVLPEVTVLAGQVQHLVRSAPPESRDRFLMLAARAAEYAGWMAQEAGSNDAACRWTAKAVELAIAARDRELEAYAMVRRGLIALYRPDAYSTIGCALKAQANTKVGPRVRGLAAQREAQGHALAGDEIRCLRALDRAADLLARARAEEQVGPILGPTNTADQAAIATGWCLHDLGRSGEATEVLGAQFAAISLSASRARARYGTRLALAAATAGDVDHACAVMGSLLEEVKAVDSATIRTDVTGLMRVLTSCNSYRPVRELYPRLTAAMHTPS